MAPRKIRSPIPPAPPEIRLPPAERIHVDPGTVRVSEYLLRDSISEEALDRLTDSVRNSGFATAATGMRRADGSIVLTGGKRLLLVARRLQCTLPIDVRPEGLLIPVVEALLAHSHQESLTVFEQGRLYRNSLKEMTRVLGYPVTQAMLSAWVGINSSILSQCLRIIRNITPEFTREHGIDFTAVNIRSRTSLYPIAKIEDQRTRAAHLIKLVTGRYPIWFATGREIEDSPPYTRRAYGLRSTYSIRDISEITDAELEELAAVMRLDVEISRRAKETDAAA